MDFELHYFNRDGEDDESDSESESDTGSESEESYLSRLAQVRDRVENTQLGNPYWRDLVQADDYDRMIKDDYQRVLCFVGKSNNRPSLIEVCTLDSEVGGNDFTLKMLETTMFIRNMNFMKAIELNREGFVQQPHRIPRVRIRRENINNKVCIID